MDSTALDLTSSLWEAEGTKAMGKTGRHACSMGHSGPGLGSENTQWRGTKKK